MEQNVDRGSIWILMFVLAFAVVIIDERLLRVLVAFVPALLLAQRALHSPVGAREDPAEEADRREDRGTRGAIDELLRHIREFYLTCHLLGSGKMSPEEAVEQSGKVERELNRLLARVNRSARTRGT